MTQNTDYAKPENFIQIVKWYMRYVLISGCKYTTNKNSLAYLALYTFISTYKAMQKNQTSVHFSQILETMLATVADDISENPQKAQNLFTGNLIGDDRKWMNVIDALNSLDPHLRQITALYNIEMLTTNEIAKLYGITIQQIRENIENAEQKVQVYLTDHETTFDTIAEEINILGRMINMDVVGTVAASISDLLDLHN